MYHRLYQQVYHRSSGPVHPGSHGTVAVTPLYRTASGVPGARSLTFATPGPWAVPCLPLLSSRGTDARRRSLRPRGQGYAPAPRLASLARPSEAGKLSLTIPSPLAIQGGADGGVLVRLCGGALIRVPLTAMAEWIRRIFSNNRAEPGVEFDLLMNGMIEDMEPVKTITEDRFRIRVFTGKIGNCDECGRRLHWLSFEFLHGQEWKPILSLDERNLRYVIVALRELIGFLKSEENAAPDRSIDFVEIA